ncbi:transcriptional regulator MelR [Vibrio sp. DW001]|uniref:transcriptional regulator MelR n=1 Tax=Vibrio sp. DW001 TaxID=2912315 RepID=UPI0023B0B4F7|nr:transcriptional regulator MelR [Vibrio sp. DW001]WED28850.1 transcriptional regulator MelR [Vibrio sp. DW001]
MKRSHKSMIVEAEGYNVSPLSLIQDDEQIDVQLRAPIPMSDYHWHNHLEVNIPLEDEIELLINGIKCVVSQGQMAVFWALTPHQLLSSNRCSKMAIISIPLHLLLTWTTNEQFFSEIINGEVLVCNQRDLVEESRVSCWQQELEMKNHALYALNVAEIRLLLNRFYLYGWHSITSTVHHPIQQQSSDKSVYYLWNTLKYISENYDSSITIKDIADTVGINEHYLMTMFKKKMHISIKQYILKMRLEHAKAMLTRTNYNITDIAMVSGFGSVSRFFDCFSKHVDVTPGEYRKRYQGSSVEGRNELTNEMDDTYIGGRRKLAKYE